MTYGATITSVEVPDRNGQTRERHAFARFTCQDYLKGHPCLGTICGRYAGRIAKGRFTLDGVEYKLAANNGPNHLHGGVKGFDKVVWKAEPVEGNDFAGRALSPTKAATAKRATPARSVAEVTYGLTDDNRTVDGVCGHHRQAHGPQPDQSRLLEPGGRRLGRRARPRADDQRRFATWPSTTG